jgi:quercetin dioxygenase-like cupin family protein
MTVERASEDLGAPTPPIVLMPDAGAAVENPVGGVITFKLTGSDSNGSVTAIEAIAAPGEGPPLHVHPQDELILVLEGALRLKLSQTMHQAAPGSFVFIPRHTPHTWQNVGDGPARFFATLMPAAPAFERLFLRYAELAPDQRGAEAFARLSQETGALQVVGPPLAGSDPL